MYHVELGSLGKRKKKIKHDDQNRTKFLLESETAEIMHAFPELIERCAAFTLKVLEEAQSRTLEILQMRSATGLVKTLQMIQLQKVVSAVGSSQYLKP